MKLTEKIKDSIKYLTINDIVGIFKFIILFFPALIYKLYLRLLNKKLWVISEGPNDARENGYYFYKYVRDNQPEINAHYVINKKSKAYSKVKDLGNIVQFGSIKHWIFYLSATKNISSQKSANPCPPLFYVLHTKGIINGHRIYLGHGVVLSDTAFLHYDVTKFELIIAGAKPEYDYFIQHFGYTQSNSYYSGLPRFDYLWDGLVNNNQIVIMPTWRDWIAREPNPEKRKNIFLNSKYYKYYQNLLNSQDFINLIDNRGIKVYFFLHNNMQQFIKYFSSTSKNIIIATNKEFSPSALISHSALMISDYSSVTVDFAYQKRPIVYYQFDEKDFRKYQYSTGYFDFNNDGFGPVFKKQFELVEYLEEELTKPIVMRKKYLKRINDFYPLRDRNNNSRIFYKVCQMDGILASGN
jgi:CDP-glycerol glycerophosphotransferase